MSEFMACVREFIAGKLLGLALAVDAPFVFDVIGAALSSNAKSPPTPAKGSTGYCRL